MMDRDHDFGAADASASISSAGNRRALRSFTIAACLISDAGRISLLTTATNANRANIIFSCNVTVQHLVGLDGVVQVLGQRAAGAEIREVDPGPWVTVHTPLPSGCQLRGDAGQR